MFSVSQPVRTSHLIRTPPCRDWPGHVQLGGGSEQTQNTLVGLLFPSGLGALQASQEELGDVWDALLSLLLTRPRLMLFVKLLHPFTHSSPDGGAVASADV